MASMFMSRQKETAPDGVGAPYIRRPGTRGKAN